MPELPVGLPPTLLPALLDALPSGVVYYLSVTDAAGTLTDFTFAYLNPAAQRLLALPAQPATTYRAQWPASEEASGFAFHRAAFLADSPTESTQMYQVEGRESYFQLHACPVEGGLLVSFTPATSAAPPRPAPRHLADTVLAQAPTAIWVTHGPDYVFELVNSRMGDLLGHPADQVLGRPYFEVLPEVVAQGVPQLFRRAWEQGESIQLQEFAVQLPYNGPGEVSYFTCIIQPLRDETGQISRLACVGSDVTDQVRARQQVQTLNEELAALNEELRASNEEYLLANAALTEVQQQLGQLNQGLEARVQEQTAQVLAQQQLLSRILRQTPAALATTSGPEHRYSFFNERYAHFTTNRAVLGQTVAELFPDLAAQGYVALLDQVYASGEPFVGTNLPAQLLDPASGQTHDYYFDFVYQPLRDEQGQPQGLLIFAVDTTLAGQARQQVLDLNEELAAINEELTATNEELHESNTQLGRTNTDLGTFVYTASHDLKAPITNIEGLIAALRDTLPAAAQQDDVVGHLLGLLDDTVQRFLTTITQLTDLSRLQRAYEEPAAALALAPVVAGVLADLAPAITEARAAVEVRVSAELYVSFSPAALRSIVYNLLSNAVKYRDPQRPATVAVQAARQPGAVVLTVRDNGLGLTKSQQQRLFGLFQRLHTHVEGSGVGLYMTKRLIENAGATIVVASLPDAGTTFTVTFPA